MPKDDQEAQVPANEGTDKQQASPPVEQAAAPPPESKEQAAAKAEAGVATQEQNAALEHSETGSHTRGPEDLGVPMLPGDPSEPQGPEDAFGEGPKRGDYSKRLDGSPHFEATVDDEGRYSLDEQTSRTADVGDAPGLKGGVETG